MLAFVLIASLAIVLAAWYVARAVAHAPGADIAVEERQELLQVRDRLLAQLNELDVETGDHNLDASVVDDERRRLEGELAKVLRGLDEAPIAAAANAGGASLTTRRAATVVLALVVPLTAMGLYGVTQRHSLGLLAESQIPPSAFPPQVLQMVARLEQRLQREPNDPQGWARLGRAYQVMERLPEAREAYAKAYSLAPGDPAIMSDFGAILIAENPSRPTPQAQALFQRLHALDPQHPGALWVLGVVAYNDGKFARAQNYWRQLLEVLPPNSGVEPSVRKAIEQARARINEEKKKK